MNTTYKNLSMIFATTKSGLLGVGNNLPWKCPEDLGFFKDTTMGKTVVMGRKTWESLPFKKGLPGRKNLVISSSITEVEGATVYGSVEAFLKMLSLNNTDEEFFVIGGKEIYEQLQPYCNSVFHTLIPNELLTSELKDSSLVYPENSVYYSPDLSEYNEFFYASVLSGDSVINITGRRRKPTSI